MKIWVFWAEINRISLVMLLLHQSYEFLHTVAPTFNNESNQIKIELYTVLECRLIMKFKVRTVTRNRIPMKMPTANIGERTSSNWNKREGNRQLIARSTVTQRKNIRKPTNRVKMSSVHVAHRYTCTWMTHNSISRMNWCELRMWCREWGARRAMKKWALTCPLRVAVYVVAAMSIALHDMMDELAALRWAPPSAAADALAPNSRTRREEPATRLFKLIQVQVRCDQSHQT